MARRHGPTDGPEGQEHAPPCMDAASGDALARRRGRGPENRPAGGEPRGGNQDRPVSPRPGHLHPRPAEGPGHLGRQSHLQANAAHAALPGRVREGDHLGPYPGRRRPRRGRGPDRRQAPGAGLREDTSREGLPGRQQVGQRGRQDLQGEPGYYQGRQGLDLHDADRRNQC